MLAISYGQMAQLRRARALELVPRYIEQLRAHGVLDESQWTSETIRQDTATHVETALTLGLCSGRDVLGFLMLRHTVGAGIERLSRVNAALRTPSEPEGWRIYSMLLTFHSAYWVAARDKLSRAVRR